ncbi:MAG: hypothetical protein EYC62_06490 [Alphaproteobacteria bacterium]|nr:MAG: hypothetical protein EYC62_06490 [Alphaproteobacteria bacterium]
MRLLFSLALFLTLSACAGLDYQQSSCEKKNPYFPDMVNCLDKATHADTTIQNDRNNDLLPDYTGYAKGLAEQVKSKKISEDKARSLLADRYNIVNAEVAARKADRNTGRPAIDVIRYHQQICEQEHSSLTKALACTFERWKNDQFQNRYVYKDIGLDYLIYAMQVAKDVVKEKTSEDEARSTLNKRHAALEQAQRERIIATRNIQQERQDAANQSAANNWAYQNCVQQAMSIPKGGFSGPMADVAACQNNPYLAGQNFQRQKQDFDNQAQRQAPKPPQNVNCMPDGWGGFTCRSF